MTEGIFPKADGEILYASEVNGFYNGLIVPKFSSTGSFMVTMSGTTTQRLYTLGSWVLSNYSTTPLCAFTAKCETSGNIGWVGRVLLNGSIVSEMAAGTSSYTMWMNGHPFAIFSTTSGDILSMTGSFAGGTIGSVTLSKVRIYSAEPNMIISGGFI